MKKDPTIMEDPEVLLHRRFRKWCSRIKRNDSSIRTLRPSQDENGLMWPLVWWSLRGETQCLFEALVRNTVLEDVEISFGDLRFAFQHDLESLCKLRWFLCNNEQLRVLRIRVESLTDHVEIQQLFQGEWICSNLNELYLDIKKHSQSPKSSERLYPIFNFIGMSQTLTKLVIQKSRLEANDLQALASGLEVNKSLRYFELNDIELDGCCEQLFMSISNHERLLTINLIKIKNFFNWFSSQNEFVSWTNFQRIKQTNVQIITHEYMYISFPRTEKLSIDSSNMKSVTKFLMNPSLSCCGRLYLDRVKLPSALLKILVRIIQDNDSLEYVSLKDSILGTGDGALIARAIVHSKSLRCFCFLHNGILENKESGRAWKDMLEKNTTLQRLELSFNKRRVCNVALTALFQGLEKNTSLQCISIKGLYTLRPIIKGRAPGIRNKLSRRNLCRTIASILNPSLERGRKCRLVDLKVCHLLYFDDSDWVPVAESIQHNKNLQKLDLSYVGLGDQTVSALATSLTKNYTLQVLRICEKKKLTVDSFHSLCRNLDSMQGLKRFEFYVGNARKTRKAAEIIAYSVKKNSILSEISHMYELCGSARFYLDLNGYGRRFLYNYDIPRNLSSSPRSLRVMIHNNEQILPLGLWPLVFARMAKDVASVPFLYYFLREKAELLATVSVGQNEPQSKRHPASAPSYNNKRIRR